MKQKYLLILIAVMVVEIIGISAVVFVKEKKQKKEKEVSSLENVIIENNIENSNDHETEEIRLGLIQAKQQIEQREKELQDKRKEILTKRKALFSQSSSSNVTNVSNTNKNNTNTSPTNKGNEKIEKDNTIKISQILEGKKTESNYASRIEDLGVPLLEKYGNKLTSRNVWDMQLFKNRIYIGSGDYNLNTGPVDVYYYDIEKEEFIKEGTLEDEQIDQFVVIDDKLIITGTDPRTNWNMGTYYEWKDNSWITNATLTGAIHNFDMVKFKGNLFAGIGAGSDSPVIMSKDEGKTFSYVYLYDVDGNKIEINDDTFVTSKRVYELIVFKDNLYAVCAHRLYKYYENENIFKQVSKDTMKYKEVPSFGCYTEWKTKLVYKDNFVIINGEILYTDDIENFDKDKKVQFDQKTFVYDAIVVEGELHVLCATPKEDGGYIVSVYKTNNFEDWEIVMYFEYNNLARSFEYSNGVFYFGIGNNISNKQEETNVGRILRIKK